MPHPQLGDSRRAVLYARVSSKEQEKEGFSIPAQRRLLRDYARVNHVLVVREFMDIETAKQAGRAGFGEMVDFLKANPTCRILLVEKTDRLYRNLKDYVSLDELDLEIHFAKENVVLSHDSRSSEKFMHGIKVLMAKNYIDNLSEETRKGLLEKAEQGLWPSFAPLGYRNVDGPNGKRTIEPDPDKAPIIRRMFESYASGTQTLHDVTRQALAEGLVFRKSKAPVPLSTVHRTLHNRIYMGEFEWSGRIYRGLYEPLVSPELWQRVQEVLAQRFRRRHRKAKHDFAFSRLISCGHCGCSLVGELKKERYVYYHCTGYKGRCPEPYTRQEVLDEKFARLLESLTFDDEVMDWVSEALRQSHADEKEHHDTTIARLQDEYNRLQNRLDVMYVDKLDGRISVEFFESKSREWRTEQERLVRSLEAHQNANQAYFEEGVQLLGLARRAGELFRKQDGRSKRRLLDFVLSNCTWKDGDLQPTFRQPFDMLSVAATTYREQKAAGIAPSGLSEIWGGRRESNP